MSLRRKIMLFALCAILPNLLMPRGSAWRLGRKALLPSSRDSLIIDEDTVEQIWINCSLDLMDFDEFSVLKYIIRDSQEINRRTRLLLEGSTQEAMTIMSPEIKNKFLTCLSKQNFPFQVTGEVGRRNMFTGFLESFFGWNHDSRRHLADKPFEILTPALAPSFISARALAPSIAEVPSPNFGIDPPSYSPAPSLVPAPASTPTPAYTPAPAYTPSPESTLAHSGFLPDSPSPPIRLHPTKHPASTDNSPVLPSKKQNSNRRSMIVAVAITTALALLLAACLAFVCVRHQKSKKNSGYGQKDEISLLALSDLSSSSQKTVSNGNPINKNGLEASPLKNNSIQEMKSADAPSSEVLSGVSSSSTEQSTAGNAPVQKLPLPPGMVPPAQKADKPHPVPPPPPPNFKPSPQPPPPPKGGNPPRPPQARPYRPSPLGPKKSGNAASNQEAGINSEASAPKTKLKPFFWDKVQANTDQSMVWDQLKAGSFQFNEEMIESLFGYNAIEKQKSEGKKESSSKEPSIQYVQILEPKKSQNLAISLKAMNVKTEEVCDALMEGNELPIELLQTLLRMVPTTDEELKLRLYSGDLSLLGPAEQFLKALVDIPFAFPRMDALLFMACLQDEASSTKESFSTLEVACKELRSSRLFLKLLEAVLKTGNRMNDGTYRGGAQAFKLDTLLKLSDVKGTDGKTTLLHFVVQEIIRSEGVRAARLAREGGSIYSVNSDDFADDTPTDSGEYFCSLGLKVVSGLSSELENVKKAAGLDADALTSTVASLGHRLVKTKEFLNTSMRNIEEDSGFHQSLKSFIEHAEAEITSLLEEEQKIRSLLKNTTEFFYGNTAKDEGLRLFVIVRNFLGMVDKACKQVTEAAKKTAKTPRGSRDALTMSPARDPRESPMMSPARDPRDSPSRFPVRDPRQLLFPAIKEQRIDYSSSDDED